ncbi:hypothetical protein E2C01_069971 [Portunus trituberculatus]|uniref:Uncharacterized protein n=1 Tax=Portunus trituberculatus TaxID=210409 RepID=A0A5B7HRG2_PORTR|nr:hypothetical protein [Portunus trituberculatus]
MYPSRSDNRHPQAYDGPGQGDPLWCLRKVHGKAGFASGYRVSRLHRGSGSGN